MIRTPLSAKFYEEPGFEEKRALVTASRRIGEPQDIANVAAFLASPRSAYINAAEILVDGGMSSMLMDMVPRPGFNHTT
jgi:NAD(P)-dependent dehydrogenase (short-subunit alcohol dehydrogenase family)